MEITKRTFFNRNKLVTLNIELKNKAVDYAIAFIDEVIDKPTNYFVQSYPIFCIAVHLLEGREDELDIVWGDAAEVYSRFLDSEFNDPNKSELDCINNFMANI